MELVVATLSERIFTVIRDRIARGEIEPGEPISQSGFAREFGVSRIPLREALFRLEQEGLLASEANKGFFLPQLSAVEAEEIFALRLKIEPDAIGRAAEVAGPADHAAVRQALSALAEAVVARSRAITTFSRAFHLALVQPGSTRITIRMVERLHVLSARYVRKHLEPVGRAQRMLTAHRKLATAWLAGDGDRAAARARECLVDTLDGFRRQFAHESEAADAA